MTSQQALRRMRRKIWDYDGTPKEEQAERVLMYLKERVLRTITSAGPYARSAYAEVMWM